MNFWYVDIGSKSNNPISWGLLKASQVCCGAFSFYKKPKNQPNQTFVFTTYIRILNPRRGRRGFKSLEITKSPSSPPPKKPTFLKITNFQEDFQYFQKVGFLEGWEVGFQTFCKVLKYIGEDGFIIFWTKIGHFLREHRGAKKAPPMTKRIFSTPCQIGLTEGHKNTSNANCKKAIFWKSIFL